MSPLWDIINGLTDSLDAGKKNVVFPFLQPTDVGLHGILPYFTLQLYIDHMVQNIQLGHNQGLNIFLEC